VGFTRVGEAPGIVFHRGPLTLRLCCVLFSDGGPQPYYVYYGMWDQSATAAAPVAVTWADRLRNAWHGQRVTGRQSLQVVVSGVPGIAEAESAVRQFLDRGIEVSAE
jgi:hypothetical protein